jgi:hypothetical protein
MGKNFSYVDNSNVYIEGCRISAVRKKMPGASTIFDAMNNKVVDLSWHLDYGTLHQFACGDPADIGAANLWGSPPPGDSFWKMVDRVGFKVVKYDKNAAGKEKKVDVAIASRMIKDAFSGTIRAGVDEITLVSGDSDFVPAVETLRESGFRVDVVFWAHAGKELREAANRFVSLDPHFEMLSKAWVPKVG